MNKAKLTPSLWFYTIHSNNAELIHQLESYEVPIPISQKREIEERRREKIGINFSQKYDQYLIESIKCHHNDIINYIENNFFNNPKIMLLLIAHHCQKLQYHHL